MIEKDPTLSETVPSCGNCGYSLIGPAESSKTRECGKPIVEVLVRNSFPGLGGYQCEMPHT